MTPRRHKYGAVATVIDGIRFASKKEARRYGELKLLEQAGEIRKLELQPRFPLYVCRLSGGRPNGEVYHVCDYVADFLYHTNTVGAFVIEDVKSAGTRTPMYRLKRKMVEAQNGIVIHEV